MSPEFAANSSTYVFPLEVTLPTWWDAMQFFLAPSKDPTQTKRRKDLTKYLFVPEPTDIFPLKCTDKKCVINGSSSIFRFLTAITDKAEPCINGDTNNRKRERE